MVICDLRTTDFIYLFFKLEKSGLGKMDLRPQGGIREVEG
jgi:hypothetical protein